MDITEGRSLSSLKLGVSTIALYVESFTQLPQLSLEEKKCTITSMEIHDF